MSIDIHKIRRRLDPIENFSRKHGKSDHNRKVQVLSWFTVTKRETIIIIIIIIIVITIELTHSKTTLENTVEIEPQPVASDFKNLSEYSSRSK